MNPTGADAAEAPRARQTAIVVLATLVCLIPSGTAVGFYANTLFLKPVTAAFGWSRSDYYAATAFGGLLAALLAPGIGLLCDRFGVRRALLPGILAYAAAMALLSTLNGSVLQYFMISTVVSVLSTFQGPLPYSKVVSAWAGRRRGLALAVALSGTAIGGMVVPPYATWLIGEFGWRLARLVLGASVAVVAFPVALAFVREPVRRAAGRAASASSGLSVREAVSTLSFWMLAAAFFLSGLAINAVLGHMAPLLEDRGLGGVAAWALSAVAAAQVVGRFAAGQLLDRTRSAKVAVVCFLSGVVGAALLAFGQTVPTVIAAAVFTGLGLGSELELASYFVGRFFGLKNFGQIFGLLLGMFLISVSSGPWLMALAFDAFGNYRAALIGCEGVLLLACVAIWLTGAYRFQAMPEGEG